MTLEQASREIGCPQNLLKHLIRNNIVPGGGAGRHERKRCAYLLPQTLAACRRWYASIATRDQAKEQLHLAQRAYVALLSSGLLRPLTFGQRPYFQRSDLEELCRQFEGVSLSCPSDISHLQSLFGEWLPSYGQYRRTSPDILHEALRGGFPIFRRLDYPGLSAYFVDWRAIDRLNRFKRDEDAKRAQQAGPVRQLSLPLE